METRKITIVQTKDQKKSVIMSAATTLAELKTDLRANGIDYTNMTFFEGTSKVELKTDNSVLPHDVPWKGTTTNELVFMLTNTNKKIKSGTMSRIEAYNAIKSMNLQDECRKKLGKNFTMCKTIDLISLVEDHQKHATETTEQGEVIDAKARKAILKLVEALESYLGFEEVNDINVILDSGALVGILPKDCKSKSASPYSDEEIDDMFEDIIK